eukprot:361238-Chlamydomonas_euryale.AAC.3
MHADRTTAHRLGLRQPAAGLTRVVWEACQQFQMRLGACAIPPPPPPLPCSVHSATSHVAQRPTAEWLRREHSPHTPPQGLQAMKHGSRFSLGKGKSAVMDVSLPYGLFFTLDTERVQSHGLCASAQPAA